MTRVLEVIIEIMFVGIILSFLTLLSQGVVSAQTCSDTRLVNEWSCSACNTWGERCGSWDGPRCDSPYGDGCEAGEGSCGTYCVEDPENACQVLNTPVDCTSEANGCSWTGTLIEDCSRSSAGTCTLEAGSHTLYCWISGTPTPDPGGGGDPTPSPDGCTVDLVPSVSTISPTSVITLTANVNVTGGFVDQVNFLSNDTNVVTVSPASDTSPSYETNTTGQSTGTTTVRTDVIMSGSSVCNDTASITVSDPGPWWQVINADVFSLGNLISGIPALCSGGCSPIFDLDGPGGFPGLPIYSGSYDFAEGSGQGTTSSTGWLAEATFNDSREYTYSFFDRRIPADATLNEIENPSITGTELSSGGTAFDGYYWYHFDGDTYGDLTINSDVAIAGDRKVILFIESADLSIEGNVSIQSDGQGFLLVIVGKTDTGTKGNINIGSSVTGIEGLFVADNAFSTGTAGADADSQLVIEGSVGAYGGINLQRDLPDDSQTPAEVFEYAPELMLLFPKSLSLERMRWEEVAP